MMQIIFSLFAAFQLSSANRLLLQNQAPFAIAQPAPAQPAQPAQPATPQALPAQPAQPQALPAQPAPIQYIEPEPIETTEAPGSVMDAKCDIAWVAGAAQQPLNSCAGKDMAFYCPMPNFKMNCGGYSSCAGSTFHIQPVYDLAAAGKSQYEIEGIWSKTFYALYFSVITFVNPAELIPATANAQGFYSYAQHPMMEVNRIECSENGACVGLTIILNSRFTTINQFDCENGCENCWVEDTSLVSAAGGLVQYSRCDSYPAWTPYKI